MFRITMRSLVGTLSGLLVLSLLTACDSTQDDGGTPGDDGSATADDQADEAAFDVPDGAWMLMVRFDTEPDRDRWYKYVAFVPESGQTVTSPLRMPGEGDDDWEEEPNALSADYQRALRDVVATKRERESGSITIHRLGDGSTQTVDLRELTGDIRLEPTQMIFDAENPNVLHVGTLEGAVWTVDLAAGTAQRSGTRIDSPAPVDDTTSRNDQSYERFRWRFTADGSGDIVEGGVDDVEEADDTDLPGTHVLDYDEQQNLPDAPTGSPEMVRTADGTVWAFGFEGEDTRIVRSYRIATNGGGSGDWQRLEASQPVPQGSHHLGFVRPPLT